MPKYFIARDRRISKIRIMYRLKTSLSKQEIYFGSKAILFIFRFITKYYFVVNNLSIHRNKNIITTNFH